MKQYTVTGMSCAACSARVEKAVSKVPGVTSCSVSLLTNSMGVDGDVSEQAVISAVEAAGYGAAPKEQGISEGAQNMYSSQEEALADHETPVLKRRLWWSVGFLAVLMYISMGHMMWGWPLPHFFDNNHVAMGLAQMLLTIIIMVINQKFFISGFKSLFHGAPNMDTLVAMGSAAAFVYSTYALFAMTGAQVNGDMAAVMSYMHEFYFESAAMILTLITVGKMLEARSKGRTTDALKGLMKLAPKTATIIKDGAEKVVPVEAVAKDDIFVVRPGENIPVDGIVVEGSSAVNESALTGESIPVDKAEGDNVSAATINRSGFIKCRATRVGEDTTLSQIIQMVSDAAATKAPIAKVADKVSGVFVPAVITIAVITIIAWLIAGQSFGFALARGISVLVISCPCALGLATPVAIMVGNGMGARNGILFKTAVSLEETGRIQVVALDKTGTITRGEPEVTDIIPAEGYTENELLGKALALEVKSEHPLAGAIVRRGSENDITPDEVTEFAALPGNGLKARLAGSVITGGSLSYISNLVNVSEDMKKQADSLAGLGRTPLLFAEDDRLIGIIAVADVIKEDSPGAVEELKNMGIHVVMLTGDNERTARAIGAQAGVDEVIAGVLPDGKESVIHSLKKRGRVAMVGDGINDAPALTRADIGIAIGAGTDIAMDAADIVLMKSSLADVPAAVRLSRATLTNIHENLFWAFFYNCIGIPLAAGVLYPAFQIRLNPMFGAAAMSLSSIFVVGNALRLRGFKSGFTPLKKEAPEVTRKEIEITHAAAEGEQCILKTPAEQNNRQDVKQEKERTNTMTKVISIEGMMCNHCTGTVQKALEAVEGVKAVTMSLEQKNATVELASDVSDEVLTKAVVDAGYQAKGITAR